MLAKLTGGGKEAPDLTAAASYDVHALGEGGTCCDSRERWLAGKLTACLANYLSATACFLSVTAFPTPLSPEQTSKSAAAAR